MVSSSRACKLLTSRSTGVTQVGILYHSIRNWKIGLSKRGRLFLNFFTATFIKLSCGRGFWRSESNLEVFFSSLISHSATFRPSSRLDPNFAFDGGISIAAITQAIANIPTIPPLVSFFLFIFFKFYWFIDGDRIVICSFFSREKQKKSDEIGRFGGEERMDCLASLAMAIKLSFWVKRSGTKNIEYVILCSFRPCWNASLFKLHYYYVQEERFFWASLAVLTQESSLRREGEGEIEEN